MNTRAIPKATKVQDTGDPKKIFSFIVKALLQSNCDRAAIILYVFEAIKLNHTALETKAYRDFAETMKDELP